MRESRATSPPYYEQNRKFSLSHWPWTVCLQGLFSKTMDCVFKFTVPSWQTFRWRVCHITTHLWLLYITHVVSQQKRFCHFRRLPPYTLLDEQSKHFSLPYLTTDRWWLKSSDCLPPDVAEHKTATIFAEGHTLCFKNPYNWQRIEQFRTHCCKTNFRENPINITFLIPIEMRVIKQTIIFTFIFHPYMCANWPLSLVEQHTKGNVRKEYGKCRWDTAQQSWR